MTKRTIPAESQMESYIVYIVTYFKFTNIRTTVVAFNTSKVMYI